jgi:hypothetical protein
MRTGKQVQEPIRRWANNGAPIHGKEIVGDGCERRLFSEVASSLSSTLHLPVFDVAHVAQSNDLDHCFQDEHRGKEKVENL